MDFVITLEEMGGVEEFSEFDFKMKKSTQVDHPSDLLSSAAVQALVQRKLGLADQAADITKGTDSVVNDTVGIPRFRSL